jgi:peptidyl-prolyl cis-trans isomerase SurA
MMKFYELTLLILIIFTPLKAIESHIVLKVNNEIVTNIDLDTEYKYLIALNNDLTNIDKETVLKLAKESIIREKIKKNELLKYYKFGETEKFLKVIVENFYKKLNIENLNDFEDYLNQYDLKLKIVQDKIEIEMLWNKLIGVKYGQQLNINEEILKKQIEKRSNDNELVKEYDLSEIIFQINDENDLNNKINLIQKNIKEQGFKNTANIYSIADTSKFGGNLGWVDEKQLSQEINIAIEKLEIGEVSQPIKITNVFLILKIENKKQKKIKFDKKKLLEQAILFEKNKQYNQFSIIYYNKLKLNSLIDE